EGNKRAALERLEALIEAARRAPVPRRATRPTRASKEKRLSGKVHSGRTKQLRGRVRGDD
ncbi:MAG TPA: aminoacyl-tRNA hydrolase, partial [Steroidobacteraceae bacterium]|nr:aminoacyl-tRNA hydrolase [Steroidobacteraceae bacterium]